MVGRSLSLAVLKVVTPLVTTSLDASAAGLYMLHRGVGLLLAVTEKSDVQSADDPPRDSDDLIGPVEWVAMPECNGCKKERESEGKVPRQLKRLPVSITQDKMFKRKALPVQLCEFCDGDAIEEALKAHQKRLTKP